VSARDVGSLEYIRQGVLSSDGSDFIKLGISLCLQLVNQVKMEYDDILQVRQTFEGESVALSYERPLNIVRGQGCRMYDSESAGRSFLDCVNNVAHVGHSNSQVRFSI
jgi:hypothetical protein